MKTSEHFRYDKVLGVVCCYFNPCNYVSRFLNYTTFIQNIKKHGIRVITVEAYSTNSQYRVDKLNNDTISIRCSQLYWMKECLLNIGIKKLLDEGYKNIAWVDADIVFKSPTWPESILNALQHQNVVQVFENSYEEYKGSVEYICHKSVMSQLNKNQNLFNSLLLRQGELGYGYAYKSEILMQCLLYDKAIVGAGDFANAVGCVYTPHNSSRLRADRFFAHTTEDFFSDYCNWATEMEFCTQSRLGYCNEDIIVLHHGNRLHRNYLSREDIIKHHQFRPTHDLTLRKNGIYEISQAKRDMVSDIKKHFLSRNEDKNENTNITQNSVESFKKINFYNKKGDRLKLDTPTSYLLHYKSIFVTDYQNDQKGVTDYINSFADINESNTHTRSKYKINRSEYPWVVVFSKHQHGPKQRANSKHCVVFTKDGAWAKGEYLTSSHKHSICHTYLMYIINDYEELPKNVIFTNDITHSPKSYAWVDNLTDNNGFQSPHTKHRRISLNSNGHIKTQKAWFPHRMLLSKYDFKTWCKATLPASTVPTLYNEGSVFAVTRQNILKHPKNFYESLIETIPVSSYCEEEHYFEYCWETIFS